jgi:Ca-activated chloride channel family protein
MISSESHAAGLFVRGTQASVPLVGVRICVQGDGAAALVTVSQRYRNDSQQPIEAVYSFPLEEKSAVCGFKVETGGRVIVGQVEEREKAFEQYDSAIAEGNGAFLVDQNRPNIFTASVGNLKPGQEATIELSYAAELEQHGDSVRVMIPTTISPRYVPQDMLRTIDQAELASIQPPTVLGEVPYGLSFELRYTAPQGVQSVNCPSHLMQVELQGDTALVTLMGETVQLDRDVVVNVKLAQPHAASAVVARDGDGCRAVMLNFFPDLKQELRSPAEFLFIVDRSGSMAGESIQQARNALLLALRSMDEGDRFNVIGFGSSTEKLFETSVAYSQETLDTAAQKIGDWGADLGGTELLQPLTLALAESSNSELPRQVMLLTDGQVSNEAECIALASQHASTARIFTFGIGYGASEHLVRGLARASGGQAEFIQPNERIEPIVMRQFARAASHYWKNVRIDWGTLRTDLVAPHRLPPLFDGDRLTVYGRVVGGEDGEVAIVAESPAGPVRIPLRVDVERLSDARAVPVLMARRAIQELEEAPAALPGSNQVARKAQTNKARILELALRYQLMSSQTSFIAVEERADADKTTERPVLERVPVALTKGWGGVEEIVMCRSMAAPAGGGKMRSKIAKSVGFFKRAMASPPPADRLADLASFGIHGESADTTIDFCETVDDIGTSDGGPSIDLFQLLISKQQATGCFVLQEDELALFSVDPAEWQAFLQELKVQTTSRCEPVAATLVALVLLETHFAKRRAEWQMIADKAERWLAKQSLVLPAGKTLAKTWAKSSLNL